MVEIELCVQTVARNQPRIRICQTLV